MADTKVSGLSAATAFAPATVQEFGINDAGTSHKVSAAQIAAYFPNGTQGSAWYAQVVANQGAITALVDLTSLTVTVTPSAAGRRFKITGFALFQSTVATDSINMGINEGASVLGQGQTPFNTIGVNEGCVAFAIIQPTLAAHTYKLTATRAGSGTVTMAAATANPAFILVEDIGT